MGGPLSPARSAGESPAAARFRHSCCVRYVHESVIRAPPEAVFAFHEQPDALQRLVPPWEHVKVIEPPASLKPGTRVLLQMRLGPLRLRWEAEHIAYERNVMFQDVQLRGPFRRWLHTHRFLPHPEGTLLRDEVEYALSPLLLPGLPLVRRRLRRMFEYRHGVTSAAVQESARAAASRESSRPPSRPP